MNTSNPNPISGRIIQKICALKEFWVEPGLFLATRWTAGFGAEPTAASEIANGPLSGFLAQPLRSTRPSSSLRVPGGKRFQEAIMIPRSSAVQASPLDVASVFANTQTTDSAS
jgi:hypothetical protein